MHETPQNTVESLVIDKIRERQTKGLAKYGVTMARADLSPRDWLIHAQEEAMDLAIYLEKLINEPAIRNGFIIMPDGLAFHNACNEPCDMLVGPCVCGAWHRLEDLPNRIFKQLRAQQ